MCVRGGDRGQRVGERGLPEIHGDRRLAEGGVEHQVQVREARDRGEDRAAARGAEHQRVGQGRVVRQIESGRGEVPRAVDEGLQFGLAAARDGDLRAQALAGFAQRGVGQGVGRVELGRELVLDQRLLVSFGGGEPPAGEEMFLGRAQPRPLERAAGVAVVGLGADGCVYSTTARSKSCARSASSPARNAEPVAQPDASSSDAAGSQRPGTAERISVRASQPE